MTNTYIFYLVQFKFCYMQNASFLILLSLNPYKKVGLHGYFLSFSLAIYLSIIDDRKLLLDA